MIKRIFDLLLSFAGIILLSPALLIISILIFFSSDGPVFYRQIRVGRNNKDFSMLKFRTMYLDSEKKGLLTVGGKDPRVTKTGYYLRKYKLDELPQLFNVLKGDMSLVGPRPEVRKYVNLYNAEQIKVLNVRPGITDLASLIYSNENELLAQAENPEDFYISEVMPAKLKLNLQYIENKNLLTDIKLILGTIKKLLM